MNSVAVRIRGLRSRSGSLGAAATTVAQELTRAEVRFCEADNAFLAAADVDTLQAAADRLNAAL
jgi:hypothetical protein